ncbi:PorV/PorQ family protein [bacterium]|nr:PorV/PorQ family protein [bacterium]
MKSMYFAIFIIVLFVCFTQLYGDDLGGQAGAFLRIGVGARAMALGQAYTAIGDDGYGYFYNPGSIVEIKKWSVSSSYQFLPLDRKIINASVGVNIRNDAAMALSWIHAGDDNLMGYDIDGEPTEHIANSDNAIFLTFAKTLRRIGGIGINFKYVQGKLEDVTAYSVGFDLGFFGYLMDKRLMAGLCVQNVGVKYSWDSNDYYTQGGTYTEDFPYIIKAGLAYTPKQLPGFVSLDLEKGKDFDFRYHIGAEFDVVKQVTLRTGLNNNDPCFGIGLQKQFDKWLLGFDYAYLFSKTDDLSASHCVDLGVEF